MGSEFFWVNCGSSQNPSARCKISPEDAQRVLLFKWSFTHGPDGGTYVRAIDRSTSPPRQIKMHRYLLDAQDGAQVDHINGDTLDNRRSNLRLATPSQNQGNRAKQAHATSKFKGVSWHKKAGKWRATISVNRKQIHLGFYTQQEHAALAYDEAARHHFGEFARPNFPGLSIPAPPPENPRNKPSNA